MPSYQYVHYGWDEAKAAAMRAPAAAAPQGAKPQERNWLLTAAMVGGGLWAAYKAYRWAQAQGYFNPAGEDSEDATDEELAEADDVEKDLEV